MGPADMNFELISNAEYETLPQDNEQCFLQFEEICRTNMSRVLNKDVKGEEFYIKQQYMTLVSAVGDDCGITDLAVPTYHLSAEFSSADFLNAFRDFYFRVQGQVARIRAKSRRGSDGFSVLLLPNTRTKIEFHITHIRAIIGNSPLNDDRKTSLNKRLDHFVTELSASRVRFSVVMAALVLVSSSLTGLSNATTIAADGHEAVTAILKLIGADKETENAAKDRLTPPPKMLLAPAWEPPSFNGDDDDLPF